MASASKMLIFGVLLLAKLSIGTAAAEGEPGSGIEIATPDSPQIRLPEDVETQQTQEAMPGALLLPEAAGPDVGEKKCITVCARWGEDCLLTSRGGGAAAVPGGRAAAVPRYKRVCRQTCKQFAEECF